MKEVVLGKERSDPQSFCKYWRISFDTRLITTDGFHFAKINCLYFDGFAKCETVHLDGTFQYNTKYSFQLFTVQGYVSGHSIPLLFSIHGDERVESCAQVYKTRCVGL